MDRAQIECHHCYVSGSSVVVVVFRRPLAADKGSAGKVAIATS